MDDALIVVVLSPMAGGYYYGGVLAGITPAIAAAGGRVVLVQTMEAGLSNEQFPAVPDFDSATTWDRAAGFISLAAAAPAEYLTRLAATGKPLVLAGNLMEGVNAPAVLSDNIGGVRASVDHLVEHGHTRIGFVGNFEQFDMRERHTAYAAAMADHGLECPPELTLVASDNTDEGGRLISPEVAAAFSRGMTAVIAATDRNALGMLETLPTLGITPGRDLAIIGFDDIETASCCEPTLSTVAQHFHRVGEVAAQLLLAQLRGEHVPATRHTTGSAFIARGSCGCPDKASPKPAAASRSTPPKDVLADGVTAVIDLGREVGSTSENLITKVVADVVALLDISAAGTAGVEEEFAETAARLFAGNRDLETAGATIVSLLIEYGRAYVTELPPGSRRRAALQDAVIVMAATFLAAQADGYALRTRVTDATVREQYEIGVRLLRHDAGDPRNLAWLASSAVAGACLALWERPDDPGGPLRIAGVYEPSAGLDNLIGTSCSVELFPPRELLDLSVTSEAHAVYVLPVKARGQNWGLLAIAGGIDAKFMIGRETLNHWAALLSVAFEHEALLGSVSRSEERYALAAQAANDGLWDWDIATNTVYYSPRWAATLGYEAGEVDPNPDAWFDRVHPEDVTLLRDAVRDALEGDPSPIEVEHRVRTASGDYRWMLCRATGVSEPGGRATRLVGSLTDIDERKSLEEQLRYGALHDALTGLPNRALLLDRLSWAIERSRRRADVNFAVLFLDLDGFKVVNDSLGHHIGDRLLVEVGNRLRATLRTVDTAARMGGDEFVLLLLDIEPRDVPELVRKVQSRLAEPFDLDGHQVVVTASTGIATSRSDYVNADDVLRDADIAMYRAKAGERGSYEIFDAAMHARAVRRLQTEVELRRAFDLGEFEVHYQPIVDLATSRAHAFEALIRWRHPQRGLVSPDDFLPVAEETGLIVRLGHWIVDETCRQMAQWREWYAGEMCVSVNVSNREFWHGGLLEHVVTALDRHGLPSSALKLEITEGVIMHNPELARVLMEELHAVGLQLHIDDFGTGYSSLHALHRFPIQGLKIDRSFVGGMGVDSKTMELVHTIVAMGRNLGVDVVAEGVETPQQQEWLRDVGCRFAQGYWFARPMPGESAGQLLGQTLPFVAAASAAISRAV